MHMASALISPAMGGAMFLVSGSALGYSSKKVAGMGNSLQMPLVGIMGAFVFAAQMVNFAIPATGSSGHLCGGLMLATILGPHAAFIAMFAILTVQCLFFNDGGLLALGCNIFNLGFIPCFVAYPLIFRPIARDCSNRFRVGAGAILASLAAVELGAFGVVIETMMSGITDLSFGAFAKLMLPIHLAIGLVEGVVSAAIIIILIASKKEILQNASPNLGILPRPALKYLLLTACATAAFISWFASNSPDGLEWSIEKAGAPEISAVPSELHATFEKMQEAIVVMPDYAFKNSRAFAGEKTEQFAGGGTWPRISAETSVSGIAGAAMAFALSVLISLAARHLFRPKQYLPARV